jgi:hypothetical protein
MRHLLQRLVQDHRLQLGTVLHAGAGACGELEAFRRSQALEVLT